jgi:hypothetical protein
MHLVEYKAKHFYQGKDGSVLLPVTLRSADRVVDLVASLDTGASFCLFEGSYAALLGLDLKQGCLTRFRTANSSFEAYGHEVEIEAIGIQTYSMVYFFADESIVKNVLGRSGWLDRVRVGITHHDQLLYLSDHED